MRTSSCWKKSHHADVAPQEQQYVPQSGSKERLNHVFAPCADFKIKEGKTDRRALSRRDVQLLAAYYQTLPVGAPLRPVLRRWLFSLASYGMRISDAQRIE